MKTFSKKFVMAFILAITMIGLATAPVQAQSWTKLVSDDNGTEIWAVTNWAAFSSDSSATVYTGYLSLTKFDSVALFAKGVSTLGTAKFTGWLQGKFYTAGDSINLGTAIDTTNIKTQVLKYIAMEPTKGMRYGRVSLTGSTVSTPNRTDVLVTLILVGHKRGYHLDEMFVIPKQTNN